MNKYLLLMRFDKPVGIYLLLWPTLWALFLATNGVPEPKLLVVFILGVVLMRAAGCVINDYADRKIDKLVERTAKRPLTTQEISTKAALWLFFLLILSASLLLLLTNYLTFKLAILALVLTIFYPFTKRWTHLPQLVLGLAFAMSTIMAFAATSNNIPQVAWWVFGATVIWGVIYDTIYAMVDKDDDLKIGTKSTAILFAKYDRIIIGALQIMLLLILIYIAKVFALGVFYGLSVFLSTVLMIYHQFLIKNRKKDACFKAFLHNHYIGMVIFIGILLSVLN